jgi:hypothetical protein
MMICGKYAIELSRDREHEIALREVLRNLPHRFGQQASEAVPE